MQESNLQQNSILYIFAYILYDFSRGIDENYLIDAHSSSIHLCKTTQESFPDSTGH